MAIYNVVDVSSIAGNFPMSSTFPAMLDAGIVDRQSSTLIVDVVNPPALLEDSTGPNIKII
jgi:hypothetical protein